MGRRRKACSVHGAPGTTLEFEGPLSVVGKDRHPGLALRASRTAVNKWRYGRPRTTRQGAQRAKYHRLQLAREAI